MLFFVVVFCVCFFVFMIVVFIAVPSAGCKNYDKSLLPASKTSSGIIFFLKYE